MTKIGSRWHQEDCNYYSVWNVWVSTTSFWSKECWSNLSTAHGSDSQWVAVLFCVWWYLGFQSWSHLSRGLSPGGFWALPPTLLTIGLPKCEFAISEVEFYGHNLNSSGCRPLINQTSAIKEFPTPTDKPALQRFLAMINFYRKFIKDAALILAPLTNPLKGPGKLLVWSPAMDSAFL